MAGIRWGLMAVLMAAAGGSAMPVRAQALEAADVCGAETRRLEQAHRIPAGLLTAISHVESGRYDRARRALVAWPWTVMAEGKGRYLPSKAAAIAEVVALKARGVRNIDVGCMQINLHAHPLAFPDLNAAFDPRANAGYAARFLVRLRDETGSWALAGTHYHSRTPHLAARYRLKLATAWGRLQDGDGPVVPAAATAGSGRTAAALPLTVRQMASRYAAQAERRRQEIAAEREQARQTAEAWRQERLREYNARKAQPQNRGGIPARP